MAAGTSIIYYLEDTLVNLNAGAPYTDPLTWGNFVRDTTNGTDLVIVPGTGALTPRFSAAGYTGLTLAGDTGTSGNIDSGDTATFEGGAGITTLGSADKIAISITGADTATAGQTMVFDGSGGVAPSAPLTIAAASTTFASINASNELEISQLLVSDVAVDATAATIAAFVATDYTGGTEYQEGDVVVLTAATGGTSTFIHNGGSAGTTADFTQVGNPAGAVQNFIVASDTGTSTTIVDGVTHTIAGGTGIATVGTAGATTLNLEGAVLDIANLAQPGTAGQYALQYDQATDAYSYVETSTLDTSLADTDQTLTGARSVTQGANVLTFGMTGGNVLMSGGDLEVDTNGKGLILKSPNGTRYRVGVNNIGALLTAAA